MIAPGLVAGQSIDQLGNTNRTGGSYNSQEYDDFEQPEPVQADPYDNM